MGVNRVRPDDKGKYKIKGKNNKDLDLTLDTTKLDDYIVEELDGADMNSKLPTSNPYGVNINWFACFSVYNNNGGQKGGYASVKYSFEVSLDAGQRLFVGYGGAAHEVTDEIKNNGKVTLSIGDPPVGSFP